ncbi:N-acetylglucosamine kinase [Pelagibius sp. Alg239-R121]|uniref:N-acetylglucosamine kinase n=1 Tax=Pelagibius sp. Alg239-R121 TaxID=2993448 RepID=UPI0024A6E0CD|nr:N-acetylglucosamine kinase [Pelagibius sp. Alg239-R121]
MNKDPFFLGVDGGGTGCRARIEDAAGQVLGQGLAGPAATRLGIEKAWAAIMTASSGALDEAGLEQQDLKHIWAGMALAGLGRKGALDALSNCPHDFAEVVFVNDGMGACLGAHSGQDGAIVIAGTGSVGIGIVGIQELRVGGYGFPISDEGSGAFLGLNTVRAALRAHDGREEKTALLAEVMKKFSDDPMEVVKWMDQASATDYAAFASAVLRHAEQGDPAARQTVQAAAGEIDTLVRALLAQGAPRVSLLGGLASPLEPWLALDVRRRLKPADGDAVSGAILLARRSAQKLKK